MLKGSEPPKPPKKLTPPKPHPMVITEWPKDADGMGMSVGDGFKFGVGFGLALTIALPIILGVIGCIFWFVVGVLGASL